MLVALRPGVTTPALAARMAATFDRLSGGRVRLNLVGGDEQELKGDGVYEDHATRYKTAAEYTTIWREILKRSHSGESFTFHGEHLSVEGCKTALSTGTAALSTALVWRFFRCSRGIGHRPGRYLPDLGRTTGSRERKN